MAPRLLSPRRAPLLLGAIALLSGLATYALDPRADEGTAKASPPSAPALREPPPADAKPEAPASFAGKIDAVLAEAGLFALEPAPESAGARIGLVVLDLERGETLYARNPDLALNPASNAKLLTTAAALSELGPEHRYATRLWTDATIDDGAIQGPLYLQGGGDPSLVTGELYELAGELRGLGIRKIQGPIIVDAGRFDRDGLPPGFDQKTEFASYRAPGGAMSVNYNTFEVHAAPGEAVGGALRFVVEPPVDDIVIASEAQTVAGGRNKLWVSSADKRGKTTITFHGEIGVDAPRGSYRYPVSDPSRYAASVLALALEERGIKLRKTTPTTGEVPQDARLLATSRSETLSELCRAVNKWSNNFMAEQILRTLAPGEGATAEAALEVLRAYSREIGMDQRGLVIGNGSGLYANNLVSAHAMTQLLAAVYADFRIRSDYLASLAIMGRDGTTRSRLHDSAASGWIRVKTGTLDDVSALSGYAGSEGSAAPLAFSILMNGLERRDRGQARAVQDAVAELVAAEAVARRARD